MCHFEEASLLPDKESFEELVRRMSGTKGPVRQLILTTNPERTGGWISEAFKLKQRPKPDGTFDPIIPPCDCQYCQDCLIKTREKNLYLDKDTNSPSTISGAICLVCNGVKQNNCPGDQVYYRIIQTGSSDNPHLPQDYVRSMMQGMDERTAAIFVQGKLDMDIRESYIYRAFTEINNVNEEDIPVDLDKELIWSLDFNFDPQSSVVCQEIEDENGFHVRVVDEIVLWNSLPEHAAEEFSKRFEEYKDTNKPVIIYGDPAGLWGTGDNLIPSVYSKIREKLIQNGFQVTVKMKKPDKNVDIKFRAKVKIPIAERIEAVNAMLCNAEDPPKVRIKINPCCRNLIRSLSELQFTEDGKSIDKNFDKRAGRSSNKVQAHAMTHPTDALGYYIYKRFPVIKNKTGLVFFQIPGESVVEMSGRGVSYKERAISKDREQRKEDRKLKREQRRADRATKKERNVKNYIEKLGWWGDSSL